MPYRGYNLSFPFALFIVVIAVSCDYRSNSEEDTATYSSYNGTSEQVGQSAVLRGPKPVSDQMPNHSYLNTVDWELRQPLDLSMATVTTTAKSTAEEVHFRYFCDGFISESNVTPRNEEIKHTVNMVCDDVLTVEMTATGPRDTIEYVFEIDIAFLNSLGG
jgi:hypothetical protein